jgi:ABC-type nickel/cobalt efflux system permease component RcnA
MRDAPIEAAWGFAVSVGAQAARPFQPGPAEPSLGGGGGGPFGDVLAFIAIQQAEFYRALTAALDRFQSDPAAAWILIGLSLAYGVFHAAGPGHGKAVISAYVVAERQTALRAIGLSFAAAFVQATTAVVLVVLAAEVLRMTSTALTRTTEWIETASYALITMIGAVLVWSKAVRPLIAAFRGRPPMPATAAVGGGTAAIRHGGGPGGAGGADVAAHRHTALGGPHHHHHHHHHADGCGCGHQHGIDPAALGGTATAAAADWRRQALIALSVGIRPCSGAIIVLVFALAQGLVIAGVASAYAMALGTGTTVAALALLALGARGLAARLIERRATWALAALKGIEALAAFAVLALGLLLLAASLR